MAAHVAQGNPGAVCRSAARLFLSLGERKSSCLLACFSAHPTQRSAVLQGPLPSLSLVSCPDNPPRSTVVAYVCSMDLFLFGLGLGLCLCLLLACFSAHSTQCSTVIRWLHAPALSQRVRSASKCCAGQVASAAALSTTDDKCWLSCG